MNAVVEQTEGNGQAAEPTKGKAPKAPPEKVTMTDGRIVEFAGKRKMLKSPEFNEDGTWKLNHFDFRDGRTLTHNAPSADLRTAEGELMIHKLAAHGSEQKVGDETAGAQTISDMFDVVEACIDRLDRGEWYVEGAGEGARGMGILLKALVEFTGKTADQLRPWLKGRSADERKALQGTPQIKPIIQRLQDEELSKAAHIDTGAMMDSLKALGAPTPAGG